LIMDVGCFGLGSEPRFRIGTLSLGQLSTVEDGPLALCSSVMLHTDLAKAYPIPGALELAGRAYPAGFDISTGISPRPAAAFRHVVEIRPSDIDSLNHMNNSVYLALVEDALVAAREAPGFRKVFPRCQELLAGLQTRTHELYIEYNTQAVLGDRRLVFHVWSEEAQDVAHGANWICLEVSKESGVNVARVKLKVQPVSATPAAKL